MSRENVFVEIGNVTKHFKIAADAVVRAIDGVSFTVNRDETLAIVGESGSGKSTLGRLMIRLMEPTSGRIVIDGNDVTHIPDQKLKATRRDVQMIFQDPYSSLDPRMSVAETLGEALVIHGLAAGRRNERITELLGLVGLDPRHASRYPHQFSGGQRQRIGIARALSVEPRLIVGDEPVSALDVSVRAQVLNLLSRIRAELGLTFVMITHDLSVVRHSADRVLVLYLGKIVELGRADDIFARPKHPYTSALIAATPDPFRPPEGTRQVLGGEVPSPIAPPTGCRFHTRCPMVREICRRDEPALLDRGAGHSSACHFADEVRLPPKNFAPPPLAYEHRLDVIRRAAARRIAAVEA